MQENSIIKLVGISQRAKNRIKEHGNKMIFLKEDNNGNILLESLYNTWKGKKYYEKWKGRLNKTNDIKIIE